MKIETNERGELVLKEVFSGVLMEQPDGNKIAICMRDDTFEINVIGKDGKECWHRVDMQSLTITSMVAAHAYNEPGAATCKGSFSLGTACGQCAKCEAQIDSGQAKTDSHSYVDNSMNCRGSMALGNGCGVCSKCRQEQRDMATTKPRNIL